MAVQLSEINTPVYQWKRQWRSLNLDASTLGLMSTWRISMLCHQTNAKNQSWIEWMPLVRCLCAEMTATLAKLWSTRESAHGRTKRPLWFRLEPKSSTLARSMSYRRFAKSWDLARTPRRWVRRTWSHIWVNVCATHTTAHIMLTPTGSGRWMPQRPATSLKRFMVSWSNTRPSLRIRRGLTQSMSLLGEKIKS